MSKVAELAYDIEQLYIEGLSAVAPLRRCGERYSPFSSTMPISNDSVAPRVKEMLFVFGAMADYTPGGSGTTVNIPQPMHARVLRSLPSMTW